VNPTIGVSAAIEAIKRRQGIRVYAETSALKLLGLEDKLQARLEWKRAQGKIIAPAEVATYESVRKEISGRSSFEMDEAREEFRRRSKIWSYFPDEGPFRRELYPKHMDCVSATREDDEILFMAANKCGKSDLGGFCVATWATGRYPHWWTGRVFDEPITAWVVNKTAKDTRDINEAVLLGPTGNELERGTGMIPGHLIQKCTPKPGTPHAFEFINVEHVSGGTSYIVSKSYDQGREAFQGRNIPVVWNDEEIPKDIYDEEMLRIMVCGGLLFTTFTPIQGLTEMTMWFMESSGMDIDAMRHSQDEGAELVG
jgi:phage terminase large subunit-like protein